MEKVYEYNESENDGFYGNGNAVMTYKGEEIYIEWDSYKNVTHRMEITFAKKIDASEEEIKEALLIALDCGCCHRKTYSGFREVRD